MKIKAVKDYVAFFHEIGISISHAERYASSLEEAGKALHELSKDELLALGVRKGHVRLLLAAIAEKLDPNLQEDVSSSDGTPRSRFEEAEEEIAEEVEQEPDEMQRLIRLDEEREERERRRFEVGLAELEKESAQRESKILNRSRFTPPSALGDCEGGLKLRSGVVASESHPNPKPAHDPKHNPNPVPNSEHQPATHHSPHPL